MVSLWPVDDRATTIFMAQFYQALAMEPDNKAAALQQAQQYLIHHYPGTYDHPYYWAPFVLIGNWL
jgi:CHAT domain-containing protein